MLQSINPSTGVPIRNYPEQSPVEISQRLDTATRAWAAWRREPLAVRAARIQGVAERLHAQQETLAQLMAEEMGKPVAQGRAEVEKCAWACEYFAAKAAALLEPESVSTEFSKSAVVFQPLGVVLAVMPWNFPFWQVFRCAVPSLVAGNTVVLKHASNVTGCAIAIGTVFREAGFTDGLVTVILAGSSRLEGVLAHPGIRGVAVTGSAAAGRAVGRLAGQRLIKSVLELGGSDPYLVLEDADLERTVDLCARARLINSGQSCIAAKRFIVAAPVRGLFEEMLAERMRKEFVGHPLDEEATLGPLARHDLREHLHGQVRESIRQGARCLLGGEKPAGPGWFYPATVLSGVRPGMPAFDQETFGPVAAVVEAADDADALRLANQSAFGLGAAVFTADAERGERLALELEAGCCFVNDFVRSDPRLPFGGIKESGYGRELGLLGLREFVNAKTLVVR